jgi:hypothetical protein
MSIEHSDHNERFMAGPERLSVAERGLEFARRFSVDFQPESDDSITAAPMYIRGLVNEIQKDSAMEWHHGLGRNQTGNLLHIYPDDSRMQIHIVHILDVPAEMDKFLHPQPEIYIDIAAEVNDKVERQLAYELSRENPHHVIRTEIDLVATGKINPDSEVTAGYIDPDLVQAISYENALLRTGIDPSIDPDIEYLRATSEVFKEASDDQRERYQQKAWERSQGLNDQPVGLLELASLRHAIITP